jgi:extracellular elastinolytic metalloproteinase
VHRPSRNRAATLTAIGALALAMTSVGPASGQPVDPAAATPVQVQDSQAENTGHHDADNRGPAVAPSAHQRDLARQSEATVRWNRYGTPAAVVPHEVTTQPHALSATATPADAVDVARRYLTDHQDLFGLADGTVATMDVVADVPIGSGRMVMLRQRFGDLPSALDGLVSLGVVGDQVVYVTSSLSQASNTPPPATLSAADALAAAERDAGLAPSDVATSRVRLAAVPTPEAGARAAYQVVLIGQSQTDAVGYTTYVDARTGEVLVRDDLVDHEADDDPTWKTFPANPPADYSSTDTRVTWCLNPAPGCERTVSDAASGQAWDVDQATGTPTLTSGGNSERATERWNSNNSREVGTRTSAPRPARDYTYPWTNQWHDSGCSPDVFTSPQQNDIDAALTNLFVTHNRMHDWAYHLGFTEATWNMQSVNTHPGGTGGDPEQGNAQAGGVVGGPPSFASRNNANQITPPDGVAPTTNMFLWQPQAGGFYPPCVDGDYDVTVIAHEYSHAITGRMIAGPDSGWSGFQAGSMNEAHSDLLAMEYLYEYGFRPAGDTPFVAGAYVTGDPKRGIRNYDMSRSPLNYSDVAYDLTGPEVHADGEIWIATSFAVRQALVDRYGLGTPELQRSCADGDTPVEQCPGNRRWIQLEFDALLLQASGAVSMVDMRDGMLAADQMRFGGADLDVMWNAFAQRGLGDGAASNTTADLDPTPSFASPFARNATLTLVPVGAALGAPVRLYVGDYEARAVPVADSDPATPLPATFSIAPGRYHFIATGPGLGSVEFSQTVHAGRTGTLPVVMFTNLASASAGATASGDGVNLDKLIDDTEATDWASIGVPVQGRQVTVDLAGDRPQLVSRVQVSAMLRPAIAGDADPGGQNRFTALRQFQVLACDAGTGADCSSDAAYHVVYTSPSDAFPSVRPRPRAPELTLRSFTIHPTLATHLRLRVLTNQCTGGPGFAGEQDNDPRATSDCATGNPTVAQTVRVAEFQAFTF